MFSWHLLAVLSVTMAATWARPQEFTTQGTTSVRSSSPLISERMKQLAGQLMEVNATSQMTMDTRTPPKVRQQVLKREKLEPFEFSHPGIAEPVDEDSLVIEETTKRLNFYKEGTTDGGLSTWILLSGHSLSTKKPPVKYESDKRVVFGDAVKPLFKRKSTTTESGLEASVTTQKISTTTEIYDEDAKYILPDKFNKLTKVKASLVLKNATKRTTTDKPTTFTTPKINMKATAEPSETEFNDTAPKVISPKIVDPEANTKDTSNSKDTANSKDTTAKVVNQKDTTVKVVPIKTTTPKVTTLKLTTKFTTPNVTPKVTTPKVTTPKVTTSKVTTLRVTTPKVTTTRGSTPKVATKVTTPKDVVNKFAALKVTTVKPATVKTVSSTEALTKPTTEFVKIATIKNDVDNEIPLQPEAKDGALELTTSASKKTKRPTVKRKKNKTRRKRPSTEKTPNDRIDANSTKIATKNKEKPFGTQIYNYLSREVMPTVGVGIVGLMVTAGLASYFLYPFSPVRRSYEVDRKDKVGAYYYNDEYSGGISEEEAIGKVIAGMPNHSFKNYNRYRQVGSVENVHLNNKNQDVIVGTKKDEQKFVVGSVPAEFDNASPAVVPEHGPREIANEQIYALENTELNGPRRKRETTSAKRDVSNEIENEIVHGEKNVNQNQSSFEFTTETTTTPTTTTTKSPLIEKTENIIQLIKDLFYYKIRLGLQMLQNKTESLTNYFRTVQARIDESYNKEFKKNE